MGRSVLAARGQDPADLPLAEARPGYGAHWRSLAQALAASHAGDEHAASAAASAALSSMEADELGTREEMPDIVGGALDIALRFRDPDLVEHLRRTCAEAVGLAPAEFRAHRHLLAAAAPAPGRTDAEVEQSFHDALRDCELWGSPVWGARTHAAYGVWLTHQGRPDDAAAHLSSARETFDHLGAVVWLREMEEQLVGAPT